MESFSTDIKSQPEAARRVLAEYREGAPLAERLKRCAGLLDAAATRGPGRPTLTFTGMGSSYFVGLAAWYAASSAQGPARARLVEAGELLHYGAAAVGPEEVIVAISQSGESVETRRLVEEVRGVRVLGITNQDEAGEFCGLCDVVLPILAGPESAVSTKTHVNSLLVAMRLVAALGWQDAAPRDALERCPAALDEVVAGCFRRAEEVAAFLGPAPNLTAVARGPVSAASGYGALIMTEGTGMLVTAMTGGAFRHGPIEMVSRGNLKAVVAVPRGRSQAVQEGIVHDLAAMGAKVVVLTDAETAWRSSSSVYVWPLPWLGEYLAPVVFAVPFQALTWKLALDAGRTPGKLNVASKVTTRE